MSRAKRKVFVLGFDGQDPRLTNQLMEKGALPNLARLAESDGFRSLATVNPAQSPVAWTTLATGANPAVHGIFDFLRPVPEKMSIDLAITRMAPGEGGRPAFSRARAVDAFWDYTSRAEVPTSVIRWPVTFPAEQVAGKFLSGLGTPDIQGGLANYLFFITTKPGPDDKNPARVRQLSRRGAAFAGAFEGPLVGRLIGGPKPATVKFLLTPGDDDRAELSLEDGQRIELAVGTWSAPIRLRFSLGRGRDVAGVVRVLLTQLGDSPQMYVSPVEVDPTDPCYDICWPRDLGRTWSDRIGIFHTLGMPEDTKGVTDRRFGLSHFLALYDQVARERKGMLELLLGDFAENGGVAAIVFDGLDRIQHLFWAAVDRDHPVADAKWHEKFDGVIEEAYRRIDAIVGRVLDAIDDDTLLLIFSDHGFETFRKAVHLNYWLAKAGYMTARLGAPDNETTLFRAVDWSKTVAYALGFGCIYLNVKGREAKGIVSPSQAGELRREIARRLQDELTDPDTGERVVREAFVRDDIFSGPLIERAPDVVVGFEPGYRASWQTALGGGLRCLVEPNLDPWCGDHLVHPGAVPGVVFANRPITGDAPSAYQIAPTILRWLGLDVPEYAAADPLVETD